MTSCPTPEKALTGAGRADAAPKQFLSCVVLKKNFLLAPKCCPADAGRARSSKLNVVITPMEGNLVGADNNSVSPILK